METECKRSGVRSRGPFLETPENFTGPVSFELIYLSANGNYWRKLSDIKINENCMAVGEHWAPKIEFGPGKL